VVVSEDLHSDKPHHENGGSGKANFNAFAVLEFLASLITRGRKNYSQSFGIQVAGYMFY